MALRMSKKGFKEAHKQLAASAPSPVPAAMTETPPVSSTPSSSKSTLPPQIPGSASSSPLSSRSASYSPSVYREVMQSLKYGVNFNVVSSNPAYAGTWVQLWADKETKDFVRFCLDDHYTFSIKNTLIHYLLRPCLSACLSHTQLHGLLRTGQMHLLSAGQMREVLSQTHTRAMENLIFGPISSQSTDAKTSDTEGEADDKSGNSTSSSSSSSSSDVGPSDGSLSIHPIIPSVKGTMNPLVYALSSNPSPTLAADGSYAGADANHANHGDSSPSFSQTQSFGRLLDVGAGNGRIATKLQVLFDEVVTTEVSSEMCKRLREKGFKAYHTGDIEKDIPFDGGFDVITFFNVLDRCDHPLTILKGLKSQLKDLSSRVILTVPLPLYPSVEEGTKWRPPKEKISPEGCLHCIHSGSPYLWEYSAMSMLKDVITKTGYRIVGYSRLPYLSQGDGYNSHYVLDDIILVLVPTSLPERLSDGEDTACSKNKNE